MQQLRILSVATGPPGAAGLLAGLLAMPQAREGRGWLYAALAGAGLLCVAAWAMAAHYLRLTRSLQESESRHRLLADHAADVIWTMDLEGRFTYLSPSVQKLRGFTPAEALRQSLEEAFAPASADLARQGFQKVAEALGRGESAPEFRAELEQTCRDGTTVWTEVTVTGMSDDRRGVRGLLGVTRDISERRRLQEALSARATTDLLTGVWNRARLEEVGQAEVQRFARYGQPLSLIFLDLDRFKRINDEHGHETGDAVLMGFCEVVRSCLRETDLLGRWGGEEFLVLVPGTDGVNTCLLAERIRKAMEAHAFPGLGRVTVSLGVAPCREGDTWAGLVARADAALYRAKTRGRNRVECEGEEVPLPRDTFLNLCWQPSYACGHPLIDTQHRALFEHANRLIHQLLDPVPSPGAEGRVANLLEEIQAHFETEQALLEASGYPEAAAHAAQHRELLQRGLELAGLFWEGELPPGDLVGFLVYEVISRHMLQEDKAFFPHLREGGTIL